MPQLEESICGRLESAQRAQQLTIAAADCVLKPGGWLLNQIGVPFGKPPSPMMIEEAKEAFGMIADQNDDGPPELVANPLNDAVSGGRQSGSYDGYSDSYY